MDEANCNWLQRTGILLGEAALSRLRNSSILLAGIGGVGSYAAEALTRTGIGKLTIYDPDNVHLTNLNRQLPALHSTLNKAKTEVVAQRLLDINPELELAAHPEALTMENILPIIDGNHFDYVVDAIDSVNEKCLLLATAHRAGIPVISAMGAGFRLDPSQIQYADISKTYNCKLAKIVRGKLKKEYNIPKGIECVFSSEIPLAPVNGNVIGSSSFIPGIFGLFMAARVIRNLAEKSS